MSIGHAWSRARSLQIGVAIAAVLTLVLSACSSGGQSSSQKNTVLHMWSWLTASDGQVWAQMVAAFNKAHEGKGVQIKMDTINYDDYNTRVLSGVATGNAPDFGWGTGGQRAQWVKDKVVIPLNQLAKEVGLDLNDFTPQSLQGSRYVKYGGNDLYMIPMDAMSMAMEINVDHARAAGLDVNHPPTNNAEFLKWAQALTQRSGDTVKRSGFLMDNSITATTVWGIVAAQMGFKRASDDLKTACVNPEAGKAALQWVLDLFNKYKVSSKDVTDRYKYFDTGQASMFWTGPWTIRGNIDSKINFVSVPLPLIGTAPHTYYELGGLEMYRQRDTSRYRKTMEAIKWLSDNSFLWTTQGRGASVRKSILNRPDYLTAGFPKAMRGAFITSMDHADVASVPVTATDDFEIYSKTSFVSTQVQSVIAGHQSVDGFMSTVCSRWQKDLQAT